jgi:hypothetical protein
MYIYIYIYIYILNVNSYIYIYIYIERKIHVCNVCIYMYVSMYVCMYVCMYVRTYVYSVPPHNLMYKHAIMHACMLVIKHAHMHT